MLPYFSQLYPRPPHSPRHSLLTAGGAAVFVGVFLMIFQPFGSSEWPQPYKYVYLTGYGLVTFVVLLLVSFIGPSIFRNWFAEKNWTVGREILHNLYIILFIALGNLLYTQQITLGHISLLGILAWVGITLAVGILPATIITLINYNRLLRRHVVGDFQIEESSQLPSSTPLTLLAENEKDILTITAGDLLFIESADNYAEVVYYENEKREKRLLRSSLSRIEEQIQEPDIVRCHRSYIVNLRQVERISGNAQGYKLHLRKEDTIIPVARRYGDQITAYFRK